MLYLVRISAFFEKSSLDELGRMARFRIVDRHLHDLVIETGSDLLKEMRKRKTTFVYSAFRLASASKISKKRYLDSIYAALLKAVKSSGIGKEEVIRLECYDINSREGYSAKDLEVRFGTRLIRDGYTADLSDPERFVYLVLLNGNCYLGEELYNDIGKAALNPLRSYSQLARTSRAEMKMAEAFKAFGIKARGIAIDLGAAPGGWSRFLAGSGFRVLAIDTADLDYDSLNGAGLRVKTVASTKVALKELEGHDIVHLMARAGAPAIRRGEMKADLLSDDMNVDCVSSASIALRYAPLLRRGAPLIMTIKCMTRNAPLYIRQTRRALRPGFSIIGTKALPSNRQEVTLFARKR